MKIHFRKSNGFLAPATSEDALALGKFRFGEVVAAEISRPRNYRFHRKFFALLNKAYENWDQDEIETEHGKALKSFDRFRKDLTILAGYYELTVRLNGKTRLEAKSISFAEMDEQEFSQLYDAMITVILKHVLTNYTREDVDRVVEETLAFAA